MIVVNPATLNQLRQETGTGFDRILGYFKTDGSASLVAIEDGVRRNDAVAIVRPAHTLKGESLQFGAEPLAALAAEIERGARQCIEDHTRPAELVSAVVKLRPLFHETMGALEAMAGTGAGSAIAPDRPPSPAPTAAPGLHLAVLAPRRAPGGFGRRATGFGRG